MLSDYLGDVTMTKTHNAYVGVPLAELSSSARGDIMEKVAQRAMERATGQCACAPTSGTCVNGRKRGRNQERCDFVISGRRVEVKSSQLKWDANRRSWTAHWQDIKRDAYDDLLLVLYTPFGVYMFTHDGTYGVSSRGVVSRGVNVKVYAPRNVESISIATDAMLAKLNHVRYASLAFSDFEDFVTTTTTHNAYIGVPLAGMSEKARGDVLEQVARRVMEEKLGLCANDPMHGTCINGSKRGKNNAACDFVIGDRRVEVKSAQMRWDSHARCWTAHWQNIKRDAHDELVLVLYTPSGVHVFVHDGAYGVTTRGTLQTACGGVVRVLASRNSASIAIATEALLTKMDHMHYASLAY